MGCYFRKKIKPSFTPKIRSEFDTRYIDPDFTNESTKDSVNVGESSDNNENPYIDFSYDPSKNKNTIALI